jgi:hypothetical protein
MVDVDSLQRDLGELSKQALGDLSSEERVHAFAKEAAAGNDEFLKQLAVTAPEREYTLRDPLYFREIQKLGAISLQARFELQTHYQAFSEAKAARNMYSALFLLNESLSRASRDRFDNDECGRLQAAATSDEKSPDYDLVSRGTSYLASKYQALWDDMPQELLVRGRHEEFMQNLAATGLLGYPSDISGESFDDLPENCIPSELHHTEMQLAGALIDFHTRYHGWRMFAEDEIGIMLDELLSISMMEPDGGNRSVVPGGVPVVTERLCENTLSLNQEFLQALSNIVEYRSKGEEALDLEARAQRFAEEMAESVDYCDIPSGDDANPHIAFNLK